MGIVTPELGLIFWQTVVFLLVLFVLAKFAWKPILKSLKAREEKIESALKAADEARAQMAELQLANEELLKEARQERDRILHDAQQAAAKVVAEAKDKANAEGQALISRAKTTIENEQRAAVVALRKEAASLSVEIAEKLIRRELADKDAQREVLDTYLKEAQPA